MNNAQIKAIFLANGFKEKDQGDGRMDLNPYVYEAARALALVEVECFKEANRNLAEENVRRRNECDTLRAQLAVMTAERDHLLREDEILETTIDRLFFAYSTLREQMGERCKVCKGYGRYQDGDSGTDDDGRCPNIVGCDCADSERMPQYRTLESRA